eukprot:TRINITY_DN2103_c0_g1_i1.p1 TRINITY_DN2103_c0_g1~~TRINITY_DN2103_c0_g1_i1.p1  ORF type:complete len:260 (+),score=68.41 TRINITY_DN2103_c0_g1_i1:79-858(+)
MRTVCATAALAAALHSAEANDYATWSMPSGKWVSEFSGKMNVPKKPKTFFSGHPVFLWPGLDPGGQESGLFQPVLTLGQGGGTTDEPWTMADWFSNCPGYCHDSYKKVQEGDVLSWYVRRVKDTTTFPMEFEIGWSSQNTGDSNKLVKNVTKGATGMWATEAEVWFHTNDTSKWQWLPRSPYYVWDIVVKDQNGQTMDPKWSCEHHGNPDGPAVIKLDCNWSDGDRKGIAMTFPVAPDSDVAVASESAEERIPGTLARQ